MCLMNRLGHRNTWGNNAIRSFKQSLSQLMMAMFYIINHFGESVTCSVGKSCLP